MICTRCGAEHLPADPECPRCGLPLTPSVSSDAESGATSGPRRTTRDSERPWIVRGACVITVLLGVFLAVNILWPGEGADDDWHPSDIPTEDGTNGDSSNGDSAAAAPSGENLADTATVSAERTAGEAHDDAGNKITYEASNMVDGDVETAWRAELFYNGEDITITLPQATQIQWVGLTNGYTKVDPTSGEDHYTAERRITSVTWSFDGGHSVTQSLDDGSRDIQYLRIDPAVQATTITLRVNQTTSPGSIREDYTAITELFLSSS